MTSLCTPWITEADVAVCFPDISSVEPDVLDLSMTTASELLYQLTGLQYPGTCDATVRPCASPGPLTPFPWATWSYPWVPLRIDGNWINMGPCGCHQANDCACKPYPRVNLGRRDIQSIEAVVIGTTTLDPSAYRLDGSQFLVRTDGSGWPCCQDLSLDIDTEGTWYIELTYGDPIPEALKAAAASLATEYVKACIGDGSCRLPKRTQSVQKQGVTLDFMDLAPALNQGKTGLYDVDLAISAFNPNGLKTRPRVLSPDFASARFS